MQPDGISCCREDGIRSEEIRARADTSPPGRSASKPRGTGMDHLRQGCPTGFLPVLGLFLGTLMGLAQAGQLGKHLVLSSTLYMLAFAGLFLLVRTFPDHWSTPRQYAVIFALAIVCRLLFIGFPVSTDVNRYVWEGALANRGVNPYLHAPADPDLEPMANDIWQAINHKEASACYPPLAMLVFQLAAAISPSLLFFKWMLILFDLAAVAALARLASLRNIPPARVLLYAVNPLVLVFIAGEGHLDSLQVFFLLLALVGFQTGREGAGFLALGCAVMSKYLAIIVVPFMITRKNWKQACWLLPPMAAFLAYPGTGSKFFASLLPFGTVMHYNDSITVLLRAWFGSGATGVSILLLGFCLALIFLTVHNRFRSAYLAVGSLLLLLGTLHPWYLVLITPFLVFYPARAWWYLHAAVWFTFPVLAVQYQTGVFQEIDWLKILEYLPFYCLLLLDAIRPAESALDPPYPRVASVSVVIPTLREEARIKAVLEHLNELDPSQTATDVVVVDAHSPDRTAELAQKLGATVIREKRGRGLQIARGIRHCSGDVILILHADCLLQPLVPRRILAHLNSHPTVIGGALGMRYRSCALRHRLLALLNNGRTRWLGIAFGDQGQFVRRQALDRIGGYPAQMLMEDVELSFRMKENGPVCYLANGIEVSERRWQHLGFTANFRKVVRLFLTYLVERRLAWPLTNDKTYYQRYYADQEHWSD